LIIQAYTLYVLWFDLAKYNKSEVKKLDFSRELINKDVSKWLE